MPDGCGVRHLAHQADSPYLYDTAEMGGDVFVIDLREGQIKQTHRVVPADFSEAFRTSAICGMNLEDVTRMTDRCERQIRRYKREIEKGNEEDGEAD